MAKKIKKTNEHLKSLISDLRDLSRKENVMLWNRIAQDLAKPTRQRREINLRKLNDCCKDNETIIVPGKVLAEGELKKKITVAAWNFSAKAKEELNKVGKTITIRQLMKDNSKGKKIRIMG